MFELTKLPAVKDVLTQLRAANPRVELNFQNENKDSSISSLLILKFENRYIFEMYVKKGTDLAKLGETTSYCKMKNFPEIRHFSYYHGHKFQIDAMVREGNLKGLMKIFDLGAVLDVIDPKFINFINDIIKCEIEYRGESTNPKRFNDLITMEPFESRKPITEVYPTTESREPITEKYPVIEPQKPKYSPRFYVTNNRREIYDCHTDFFLDAIDGFTPQIHGLR